MARSKEEYENALIWIEEAHWAKSEHYHSDKEVNKRIKERERKRYEQFIKPFEKHGMKWKFVEDDYIHIDDKPTYPPLVIEYDGQHPADKIFFGRKKSRER
tara:strand:- start:175 stop:477 length:303 start_codon:yes stop_codon:yes gene_type:complete